MTNKCSMMNVPHQLFRFWFHTWLCMNLSHFAVTKRSLAAWARSFNLLATNDIVGGHPTAFVIRKLYCCPGQAIWATQVMPRCIDHLLKCLDITRWENFHFEGGILDLISKSKGNQGRYRIIDCKIYIHHQYSSMTINHQTCIYISYHLHRLVYNHIHIIYTFIDMYLIHQKAKTYCYRQKQFSADFCTFNRSAFKTSMSCSIFFNLNVLMLHKFALKFAAFAISNLLAFQWAPRDTQARQRLSRRCQPSTTVASGSTSMSSRNTRHSTT